MDVRVSERTLRIGQIAEQVGVSTRTLRYYEELGLLQPSSYSQGGSRRYGEHDRQRILRIRDDKLPKDIDTVETVEQIYRRQHGRADG